MPPEKKVKPAETKIIIRKNGKTRRCSERELPWFAARGWKSEPISASK